jgi:hypothetical protein
LKYGEFLKSPKEVFGSINLSIRSIISKLKQKYLVDTNNNNEDPSLACFDHLLYFKELNPIFTQLQKSYADFLKAFYSSSN